ncbi:hypothetical protein PSPO01_07502 [Paraphaeosphaeria sporulosa]
MRIVPPPGRCTVFGPVFGPVSFVARYGPRRAGRQTASSKTVLTDSRGGADGTAAWALVGLALRWPLLEAQLWLERRLGIRRRAEKRNTPSVGTLYN